MKRSIVPYVYEIATALRDEYQDFNHHNRRNPLDELLFIICSVKRTESVYLRAFKSLKQSFPKFHDLANATPKNILKKVDWGGLQNQKAAAVKKLIKTIEKEFGKPTLAPLKKMDDRECENFLLGLPGVGKKVARCVMMYSLNREVFPVDSHCWRISSRLGWISSSFKSKNCTAKNMDSLQELIPSELRYSLHVNMVSLGRNTCKTRNAKCEQCLIIDYCKQRDV